METNSTRIQGFSKIGQGAMGVGGEFSKDPSLASSHLAALREGIEAGLTLIDTAEVYAGGFSEELVGVAIRNCRSKVFVASKFSPQHSSYSQVITAAEGSLSRLGTDYLDLYQVHWPNPAIAIAETMGALDKLVEDGKILRVGVSNFNGREFRAASSVLNARIFSNQVEYSLFDRFAEQDALVTCLEKDAILLAYSPLNKGRNVFSGKAQQVLESIALKHSATVQQVQLSWLASRPAVTPIPKSTNIQRIKQNAAAMDLQLSASDLAEIEEFCLIPTTFIQPSEISVMPTEAGGTSVYSSLSEALENKLELAPSPSELAKFLLEGDPVKPVRVIRIESNSGKQNYKLVEGRLRYWAFVIAFGDEHPIPALVNQSPA